MIMMRTIHLIATKKRSISKSISGVNMSKGSIFGTFAGTCLCLSGFLMSYENQGFHGSTLYFHLPALIFCFGLFMASIVMYFNSKKND